MDVFGAWGELVSKDQGSRWMADFISRHAWKGALEGNDFSRVDPDKVAWLERAFEEEILRVKIP